MRPDLSRAPKEVNDLVGRLEDDGHAVHVVAQDSPGDVLMDAVTPIGRVVILADRGYWYATLGLHTSEVSFDKSTWLACLTGVESDLSGDDLHETVEWITNQLSLGVAIPVDETCLERVGKKRAYSRLGFELDPDD